MKKDHSLELNDIIWFIISFVVGLGGGYLFSGAIDRIWFTSDLIFCHEGIKLITQVGLLVLSTGLAIKLNNRNNRKKNQQSLRKYLAYLYFETIENCEKIDQMLISSEYNYLTTRYWGMYDDKIKEQGLLSVFYLTTIYKEIDNYSNLLREWNMKKDSEGFDVETALIGINNILIKIKTTSKKYQKMIDDAPNMQEIMREAQQRYNEINESNSELLLYEQIYKIPTNDNEKTEDD